MNVETRDVHLGRRICRGSLLGRVLLHAGRFWYVRWFDLSIDKQGAVVRAELWPATPARRSIDDCSPGEWDAVADSLR